MTNNMTGTNALVAMFADRAAAHRAAEELIDNGFSSDQVHVNAASDVVLDAASGNASLRGTTGDSSGGGISGFFHRMFGGDTPDEDRAYYTNEFGRGRTAVIVDAEPGVVDRAVEILNRNGAIDVDESEVQATRREDTVQTPATGRTTADTSIPVVQEEVQIHKRPVQRGGVRVYSNVTEQPVEQSIELNEERVRVDRRPANRPATEADFQAANREVIEVTETVEEPVIEKTARVIEEVVIGKERRSKTKTVRDNVRKSEVRVEDTRGDRTTSVDPGFEDDFRTRYRGYPDATYEQYAPAYRYGYDAASDARYEGRNFEDVEDQLRTDYLRNNPNSAWDRAKGAVRYGWEKVTGKR